MRGSGRPFLILGMTIYFCFSSLGGVSAEFIGYGLIVVFVSIVLTVFTFTLQVGYYDLHN